MVESGGAEVPDDGSGAVEFVWVSVPVDGTGGGGAVEGGTAGAAGDPEEAMNADTRLLALMLLRLY
jgi:hypothetical protein